MKQNPFRIAVLASTNGTDLGALIEEIQDGKMNGIELVRVVSDRPKAGALEKARNFGCEAIHVDPWTNERNEEGKRTRKSTEHFDKDLIEAVGAVDLVCCMGFMKILGPSFVKAYEGRIINVHPALLPKHGGEGLFGSRVHEAVLAAGDAETGMTIHYVDEKVDHGETILQTSIPVEKGDTPESLKEKVVALEMKAYPEVIRMLAEKWTEKNDQTGGVKSDGMPYKIRHDRPNCIGCTACAAIAPKFWEMSDEDGKSDVIGSIKTKDGWEELDISEEDFALNKNAAEACPVNVIHLINIGSGEELI